MKIRATKKEMRNYPKIISIGYCDAQYLLRHKEPFAYSAGINGWACDYYDINGILISTGYAPLTEKNTKRDYEAIRKYNEAARDIATSYEILWDQQKEQINELLDQFIKEAIS